jgi:hypothetical protein
MPTRSADLPTPVYAKLVKAYDRWVYGLQDVPTSAQAKEWISNWISKNFDYDLDTNDEGEEENNDA